jgi:CheY-like chemotaxis protein
VLEFLGPGALVGLDERRQTLDRQYKQKRQEIEKELQEHVSPARSVSTRIEKSTRRILWVDDNPVNNEAILDLYRPRGIVFDLALSTKQALDFLAQQEYALIISDIGRGADWEAGIEMIPEIRTRFPDSPPIVLYAHPDAVAAHSDRAKKLGASLITAAPQELVRRIDAVLE